MSVCLFIMVYIIGFENWARLFRYLFVMLYRGGIGDDWNDEMK